MEAVARTDDERVLRARRGDERAFASLVQEHATVAFRTARLITGDDSEAEDAAQEAFVKAFRALGRFRRGAPFRPWLLRIVANEARNRRAAAARRARLQLRAADEPQGESASAESDALRHDERARLLAAVEGLRDDDRLVLSCRFLLELSEEETAAALGCARGTVKSRTSRALGRLRDQLEAGVPAAPGGLRG